MARIMANYEHLVEQIAADRKQGLKIAMTNGAFDLLHVGHIRSFVHARSLADRLLVAVNTDRSVKVNKGPKRPIQPQAERAEILSALAAVDYVTLFDEATVAGLLELIKPEIYCKGTDYTAETIPESQTVYSYGGQIAIVGDPKDHSSTGLVARILATYGATS